MEQKKAAGAAPFVKPPDYYSQQRPEIIDLVCCSAQTRVLDIGCGAGGLGRALQSKGCGYIAGCECVPGAAAEAARHYNQVLCGDVETMELPFTADSFDYIICADVLEHLRDPWGFLKRVRSFLAPTGTLIASLPNLRHRAVIGELLRGNFEYRSGGILDNTHLRFFTFSSLVPMFVESGYLPKNVVPMVANDKETLFSRWKEHNLKNRITELVKLLTAIDYAPTDDDLLDLVTVQFIVVAQKKERPAG